MDSLNHRAESNDRITLPDVLKTMWLRANKGVLSEVAKELDVSPQFVRMVYWRLRTGRRVADRLRQRGAPIEW
jgi:hypothetical protein